MRFDIAKDIQRLGKRAELLVAWYLRFNGYFPMTDFILHDAGSRKQRGGQLTDADVLALRLPHTKEVIEGCEMDICTAHDQRLDARPDLIDFLIAEVTSEAECKFNWLELSEDNLRFTLRYVLRRFGYWPEAGLVEVVEALVKNWHYESVETEDPRECVRVRLLSFGMGASEKMPEGVLQITHGEILEYLRNLFCCYGRRQDGSHRYFVSDHKQWHPMIAEIYNRSVGHKRRSEDASRILEWLFAGP